MIEDGVYTYGNDITVSTATTSSWVTVSTSTASSWSCNTAVYEPPLYRRPKPPYIPFEPVHIPRYAAPPPPQPWPSALRRFRGDVV